MKKIEWTCPRCKEKLQVGAELAGKKARCPRCALVLDVPKLTSPCSNCGKEFPKKDLTSYQGQMLCLECYEKELAKDRQKAEEERSKREEEQKEAEREERKAEPILGSPILEPEPRSQNESGAEAAPREQDSGIEEPTEQLIEKIYEQRGGRLAGRAGCLVAICILLFIAAYVFLYSVSTSERVENPGGVIGWFMILVFAVFALITLLIRITNAEDIRSRFRKGFRQGYGAGKSDYIHGHKHNPHSREDLIIRVADPNEAKWFSAPEFKSGFRAGYDYGYSQGTKHNQETWLSKEASPPSEAHEENSKEGP